MSHGPEIKASRLRHGWSQENLAKMVGTKQQTIDRIEKGKILHSRWMPALLQVLGLEPEDEHHSANHQVPVVGYVGAGEIIYGIDDHAKGEGMGQIDVPSGIMSMGMVALIVRGDSMLPVYRNGDVVFYDRQFRGNLDNLIGKTCVVRLMDGRTLLKDIHKAGHLMYTLVSHNAYPITEPIDWASPVAWVKKA